MSTAIIDLDEQLAALEAVRDRAKAAFVIHLVAMATGVPPRDIARDTRARNAAARARWMAMYVLHTGLQLPVMRVASAFGRDRTTVGQTINRVEDWRSDAEFDRAVSALERCAMAAPAELTEQALAAEIRLARREGGK